MNFYYYYLNTEIQKIYFNLIKDLFKYLIFLLFFYYLIIMNIINPIIPNFVNFKQDYIGYPFLSLDQNLTHYNGHYLKYISKLNESFQTDKQLNQIYNSVLSLQKKFHISNDKFRKILLISIIKVYSSNKNSNIYHNSSQIYNHEFYWYTLDYFINNNDNNEKYKSKLFLNDEELAIFYNKFIDKGMSEFGSGWLWIYIDRISNKLEVKTTHDSIVLFSDKNINVSGVIDLWEHAYYVDYKYERKNYLENMFKIINWEKIYYCSKNRCNFEIK